MEKCDLCQRDMDLCECDDQDSLPFPPDKRKPFSTYASELETYDQHSFETQYQSVHFPGLGNLTITYENRTYGSNSVNHDDLANYRPVLSFDFDTSKVDIIDRRGNDREIHPYHNDNNK